MNYRLFLTIFGFIYFINFDLSAQVKVEKIVADTACICISKIDTSSANHVIATEFNKCLSSAMSKNSKVISDSYNGGQGEKLDEPDKITGHFDRVMIRVQNELAESCSDYEKVYGKIKSSHQGGAKRR